MRLLAVISGILLAAFLVGTLDWLLPIRPLIPVQHFGIRGTPSEPVANAHTHLVVHAPQKKSTQSFFQVPVKLMTWETSVHTVNDSGIGPHLHGPLTFTGRVIDPDNPNVVFSRRYRLDAGDRRVIPNQDPNRPGNFFFFGCSFVFGTGVSDNETLPAQFAYDQNQYTVYNYSFPAWGPNNLDRLIHLDNFAKDVPKKSDSQAIYWYLDFHLDRMTVPTNYYNREIKYSRFFPYYYLDSQNHLQTEGTIFDHRGWKNLVYQILGHSSLLSYFSVRWPPLKQTDFQLLAALIADMRDTLKNKIGADLIVAIFPETVTGPSLIRELDKKGIRSIDYSHLHAWEYTSMADWQEDTHPTASQYRFLAKQLVKDLALCEGRSCEL